MLKKQSVENVLPEREVMVGDIHAIDTALQAAEDLTRKGKSTSDAVKASFEAASTNLITAKLVLENLNNHGYDFHQKRRAFGCVTEAQRHFIQMARASDKEIQEGLTKIAEQIDPIRLRYK